MWRWRSLRTRLFAAYSLVMILIAVAVSIPMYFYLKGDIERNVLHTFNESVSGMSVRFEGVFHEFESISKQLYLNADSTGKTATQYLDDVVYNPGGYDSFQAENAIENFVFLISNIYTRMHRISIFTENGDFFSNLKSEPDAVRSRIRSEQFDALRSSMGEAIWRYHPYDYWQSGDVSPVFTLGRLLKPRENRVGYLEIQVDASDLLALGRVIEFEGTELLIWEHGHVLYSTMGERETEEKLPNLERLAETTTESVSIFRDRSLDEYSFYHTSPSTGLTIYMSVPEKELFAPLRLFRNVTLAAVMLLILLSTTVFYLLSRLLTQPLYKLKQAIDSINLDDRNLDIDNTYHLDEVELINRSFRKMNQRLQSNLEETVRFRTMQLQSHFDTLQAQINPHFLFNILGVIQASAENGQIKQVEYISSNLADFLRYAITASKSITTLEQEVRITVKYLELMKTRYLHRLAFTIEIDPQIQYMHVPRLTLQPLVENCIHHAFTDIKHPLHIRIIGKMDGNNWEISIEDNGSGFHADRLAEMKQHIQNYLDTINANADAQPLHIGGMGLVSTIARLNFLYKGQFQYEFGNRPDSGSYVTVRGTTKR